MADDEQDDGVPDWLRFVIIWIALWTMLTGFAVLAVVTGWVAIDVQIR